MNPRHGTGISNTKGGTGGADSERWPNGEPMAAQAKAITLDSKRRTREDRTPLTSASICSGRYVEWMIASRGQTRVQTPQPVHRAPLIKT